MIIEKDILLMFHESESLSHDKAASCQARESLLDSEAKLREKLGPQVSTQPIRHLDIHSAAGIFLGLLRDQLLIEESLTLPRIHRPLIQMQIRPNFSSQDGIVKKGFYFGVTSHTRLR